MDKRKLPKRRPADREVVPFWKKDQSPAKLMKRMSRDHLDVLQNIEFALVNCHRHDPGIDDLAVATALRHALAVGGTEPAEPRVAELVQALDEARAHRADVSDDLWRDALRVVADSVKTHSRLQ